MTSDLKPYPEYKDSDLPWVGKIPEHWKLERAKRLFQRMERPVRADDDVVTCFRDGVVTLRKNRRVRGFTESLKEIGYQGVRRGDLVIHAMDAFAGAIGVSSSDGKCTPVYAVCQPKLELSTHYYAYIVREMARTQWVAALARGIRERSTDFRFDGFAAQVMPVPPTPEQELIARFLNRYDRLIRRYIRAKRRLIELLNEHKQAIIHRAVTRGLDPNVRLKPSGIDWLCDIPEHWEVRQLKQLLVRMDYGTSENLGAEGPIRVLTMGHIQDGRVIPPEIGSLHSIPPELVLARNDLLFNRTNSPELVGKVGIFRGTSEDRVSFASYLVRLRTSSEHDPEWLHYLLNSTSFWGYARSMALVSLHQANLNSTRYGQMLLPVPPLPEQRAIAQYFNEQTGRIAGSIDAERREIDFIREYRTRLIADVVTGKVDVRELAVGLPGVGEAGVLEEVPLEDETTGDDDLSEPVEKDAGADD